MFRVPWCGFSPRHISIITPSRECFNLLTQIAVSCVTAGSRGSVKKVRADVSSADLADVVSRRGHTICLDYSKKMLRNMHMKELFNLLFGSEAMFLLSVLWRSVCQSAQNDNKSQQTVFIIPVWPLQKSATVAAQLSSEL